MDNQFSKLSKDITKSLSKTDKKNDGIFFTPHCIIKKTCDFIIDYINKNKLNVKNILEPSCGSCEFIDYIDKHMAKVDIDGIEKNEEIYDKIKELSFNNKINIRNDDFLEDDNKKTYGWIVGNPPYYVMKKKDVNKNYSKYYEGRPNIFIIFIIIMIIFILIFSIIQTLFSSYLESAFNHLFVMLFKTKYTFLETFKPTTYSKIVTILYTIILLPFIYMIKPFIESKQFNNTFFILITLIFIILISTLIHSFYVKAIGISHYHKLSFAKSLWSAILGNLCILVITLGLLFLIGMIFVIIFGSKIPNVIF